MIRQGLTHDPNKRVWTVKYPWVKDKGKLPNNFPGAFGQLKSLENRLSHSLSKAELYCAQFTDMVDRGAIRKLTETELKNYEGPVHYLPHHGVEKALSTSTPLRVVLNPSSSYMGHRLNDYWAKGPNNVGSLFGIVLRFREEKVAIQGDISKMYNSVHLDTQEQHVHRILWRDLNTDRPPDHYVCLVVPFGDKPSGCIVITAMRETAKKYRNLSPEAADTILKDTYVDDILKSVSNITLAMKLMTKIEEILSQGGFKVKNWIVSGDHLSPTPESRSSEESSTQTLLKGIAVRKVKIAVQKD